MIKVTLLFTLTIEGLNSFIGLIDKLKQNHEYNH